MHSGAQSRDNQPEGGLTNIVRGGRGAPVRSLPDDDDEAGKFLFAGWLDNLNLAALRKLWRERHQS